MAFYRFCAGAIATSAVLGFGCKARKDSSLEVAKTQDTPLLQQYLNFEYSLEYKAANDNLATSNCHIDVNYRSQGDTKNGTTISTAKIPRCDRPGQILIPMQGLADVSYKTGIPWTKGEIFVRVILDGTVWDQDMFSVKAPFNSLISERESYISDAVKVGVAKPSFVVLAIGNPQSKLEKDIVKGPANFQCEKSNFSPKLGPNWSNKTIENLYGVKIGMVGSILDFTADGMLTVVGGFSTMNTVMGVNFDNSYAQSMATQCDSYYPKSSQDWWVRRMQCMAQCVNNFFKEFRVQSFQDCKGHAQALRNVIWYSDAYWQTSTGYSTWLSAGQGGHVFNTVSAVDSVSNRRVRYILDAGWFPTTLYPYDATTAALHKEPAYQNAWPTIRDK